VRKFINNLCFLYSRRDFISFGILLVVLIVGAMLELFTLGCIPILLSIITGDIVNHPLPSWMPEFVQGIISDLPLACVSFFSIFIFRLGYFWVMYQLQTHIICNRNVALSSRVYAAYANAPYRIFLRRNTSEVINAIFLEAQKTIELLNESLNMIRASVIILSIAVMLFWFTPLLALCSLTIIGVVAGTYMKFRASFFVRIGKMENESREEALKTTSESIGAIKETKLYGCQQFYRKQLHHSLEKVGRSQALNELNYRLFWPILEVISILAMLVAMLITMKVTGAKPLELASGLALVAVSLSRIRSNLTDIMIGCSRVMYDKTAFYRICDMLHELEPLAEESKATGTSVACFSHELALDDVSFKYEAAERPSLVNFSCIFQCGKSYGIIGPTGAGKSTLLDLLLGILEPGNGRITVDGKAMSAVKDDWQCLVGYVPQSIFLFDDTIRANVALGVKDEEVDEKALAEALKAAQLSDFVNGLAAGDKTMIGERGVRLSGGQRQRLGIARALYRNPSVIVFDEATSALDNDTEAALTAAIESLRANHTLIIVAHRLTTVRNCDVLYKIENGHLAATGTYAQLCE